MYNESEFCMDYWILHDSWITEALACGPPTGTLGSAVWPLWVAGEEMFFFCIWRQPLYLYMKTAFIYHEIHNKKSEICRTAKHSA